MGTDIQAYVEVLNTATGEWVFTDPPPGWDDFYERYKHVPDFDCRRPTWFTNRSYTSFALLAGVRNYGREVVPISLPRGVPLNCSEEYRAIVDHWAGDGHSHSWVTLAELDAHADDVEITNCRLLADEMKKLGHPELVRLVFFFDN